MELPLNGWCPMPISPPLQLTDPDADDPLGFGLKSISEPLLRLWLARAGNPYFEAEVVEARPTFGIPTTGFTNLEDYVNWRVLKCARHGHGDWWEPETRIYLREASWPIHDFYLPGPCCPDDPMFVFAEFLTFRFGIEAANEEPGFEEIRRAVVEYILLNRWRNERSTRESRVHRGKNISTYLFVPGKTVGLIEPTWSYRKKFTPEILYAEKGTGGKLPLWHRWWKLRQEGMAVDQIAGIPVEKSTGEHFYEERSVQDGIDRVEYLMTPKEILSLP